MEAVSVGAGLEEPSPEDVVAAGALSEPEPSLPEDSVEGLSVVDALAGPPERLSVL